MKVRIAPSPTGKQIHIGNFRTILFNYLLAQKSKGEFVIRIEDTDRKRLVEGSVENLIDTLQRFGIKADFFPSDVDIKKILDVELPPRDWILKKDFYLNVEEAEFENKFIQSQRLPLYLKYAFKLLEKGYAYPCFLSEDELKKEKENFKFGTPFRSFYRNYDKDSIEKLILDGKSYVIRLNVEKYISEKGTSIVEYTDIALGKMKFDLNTVDDQVLVKANGIPTYHLAVVVDDFLMNITVPIRGYGWLPSTPKQIIIYDALGFKMSPFCHVTDILSAEGGKLSKRKGSVFLSEFLSAGYLPEAIINHVALLGWTPKIARVHGEKEREIFSINELIQLFDLSNLSKTNSIFDRQKLLWFNKQYLKLLTASEITAKFKNWLVNFPKEEQENLIGLILEDKNLEDKIGLSKDRASTLSELLEAIEFFYTIGKVDFNIPQLSSVIGKEKEIILDFKELVMSLDEDSSKWTHSDWEAKIRNLGDKFSLKHADIFMLLRVCIVGKPFSPSLFEAMQILGKIECLKRLNL